MNHIIKRGGHKEAFDERKVYASVYAACLASHVQHQEAELIVSKVTDEIKVWIKNKEEVTSSDLSKKITDELKSLNKESAYMYHTHKDVS